MNNHRLLLTFTKNLTLFCVLLFIYFSCSLVLFAASVPKVALPTETYVFIVEKGSMLSELSLYLYGTTKKWPLIAEWNDLKSPYTLHIGQRLTLHERPRIDTLQNHLEVVDMWKKLQEKTFPSTPEETKQAELKTPPTVEKVDSTQKKDAILNKKFHFIPATGLSHISYKESFQRKYSSFNHQFKLYSFYNIFRLGLTLRTELSMHTVSIKSSHKGITARLLEGTFGVEYMLPFKTPLIDISMVLGGHYVSMYGTDHKFGFRNVYYPELYPRIRLHLNKKNTLTNYAKYISFGTTRKGEAASARSLTLGMSFSHELLNQHLVNVAFEWNHSKAELKKYNADGELESLGVNLGYGF